jgi:hypothetical protein
MTHPQYRIGVRQATAGEPTSMGAAGLLGLLTISVVAGLVSGVAEALGMFLPRLALHNVHGVDYS